MTSFAEKVRGKGWMSDGAGLPDLRSAAPRVLGLLALVPLLLPKRNQRPDFCAVLPGAEDGPVVEELGFLEPTSVLDAFEDDPPPSLFLSSRELNGSTSSRTCGAGPPSSLIATPTNVEMLTCVGQGNETGKTTSPESK